MLHEGGFTPEIRGKSEAPVTGWDAIRDFKELLSRTKGGAPIATALPDFARDRIVPLLSDVTSYEQFTKSTDFLKTHMGHVVSSSPNHPQWAAYSYPKDVIKHAEDIFLDTKLYPRVFPEGSGQGESHRTNRVKVRGASGFPRLIAERQKISEEGYRRIMRGTSEAFRVSSEELGAEETRGILEKSAGSYNDESDRENAYRDRKIFSGMDKIVQDFTASIKNVRSSSEYRSRMRALSDRLDETTKAYNKSVVYPLVINLSFYKGYVAEKVREVYFRSLFEKAFF